MGVLARAANTPRVDLYWSVPAALIFMIPGAASVAETLSATVASISGIVLALAAIVMTMYQTQTGPRMARIRLASARQNRAWWIQIMVSSLVAVGAALAGIVASASTPILATALAGYGAGLLLTASGRMIFLMRGYMEAADEDAKERDAVVSLRPREQRRA